MTADQIRDEIRLIKRISNFNNNRINNLLEEMEKNERIKKPVRKDGINKYLEMLSKTKK
jgi:hypothetical protein